MIRFLLIYISLSLFLVPNCIYNLFGKNITLEQILYHISLGPDGIKGTDLTIAIPVINTVMLPLLFVGLYIFILQVLKYVTKKHKYLSANEKITLFFKLDKYLQLKRTTISLFVVSVVYMSVQTNMLEFLRLTFGKDVFSSLYIDPNAIAFKNPVHKKNLLLVYVESLENNLTNQNIFHTNLIQSIDNLRGTKIPFLFPAPGTGWSIAGMVASQCAVPLKLHYGSFPKNNGSFLPNLTCIGDVLKNFGYQQYFLAGHDLALSGTGNFYKNHGYMNNYGKKEWIKQKLSSHLFNGFGGGIHDDVLLNEAKKIIKSHRNSKKNYNLTLITVDTHAKEGFPSSSCEVEQINGGFRGAFQCSSHFVAKFIEELDGEHLLDNTIVLLMGDHPFMESPEKSDLFPDPRYVYLKILDPGNRRPQRAMMTHFDVAPTLLDLLGFLDTSETKFGLGFSVFADMNKIDYVNYYTAVTHPNILNHSQTYDYFWFKHKH